MSIGVEKNIAPNTNSLSPGLIRSVVLVETVASYQHFDQLFPVSLDAVAHKNKMAILRTIGSFGTYTWRLAQILTLENFDLLAVGESIVLKLEQKDGFGNAVVDIKNSGGATIGLYDLAPAGTYLITRNSDTIGYQSGFSFVCLNDGSDTAFDVASGVTGRKIGYGLYHVVGTGTVLIPQILITGSSLESQKTIIVNSGGLCRIASEDADVIYSNGGSAAFYDLPSGVHFIQYSPNKIFLK